MPAQTELSASACKTLYLGELEAGLAASEKSNHHGMFRKMVKACQVLRARVLTKDELDDARTWVWSDLHVGHDEIIRHANRPFANVRTMDAVLFDNWGTAVARGDRLIVCGDLALRWTITMATVYLNEMIEALPGTPKHLVVGNHDLNCMDQVVIGGFDDVCSVMVADGDPPLIFTHIPLKDVPPGAVNVHGHVHETPSGRSRHINVCVEHLDYRPVRLDRLRRLAQKLAAGFYPAGTTTAERLKDQP